MGPLARRSPWRLARSGVWGLLVTGAFLLLATAASSVPLLAEAAANAALTARLSSVPTGASAQDAPVVRVVAGEGTAGRVRVEDGLAGIPFLSKGTATAASVGVESRTRLEKFTPFVSAGPTVGPPTGADGERTARARIFGDADLARALVPADAATPTGTTQGVWLPAPLARRLQVAAGDQIQVGVQFSSGIQSTGSTVAGVYQVGPDGRLPADPAGSERWSYRRSDAPVDSEFRTLPASLLVTDLATATALADETGDDLLYAVEGRLQPSLTLAQATTTVAAVRGREDDVQALVDAPDLAGGVDVVREQVVSGVPAIVADARKIADRTVAWTLTAGAAGIVLGLLAVLAVAVFGLVRRTQETRHAVGVGVRASAIGAMAAAEVLPVALLCAGLGLLIGRALVAVTGPAGAITAAGVRTAAWHSVLAVLAGTLVVAGAAALAALRAGRLSAHDRLRRAVPWEALLVVVALTASVGLLVRPAESGPPSPLDLLVPVLVLAAVGAVGARGILHLTALFAGTRTAATRSAAWSRRPGTALAVRRVAAGGRHAVLLIILLTVGFGVLMYSLAAAASVRQIAADRTAVLAGARATTEVGASWLFDDGAARMPGEGTDARAPVPGSRTPPLPAGITMVWRSRITVPPEFGNLNLLVIDPVRFAEVASWGTGPELAHARRLLGALAAADARATARMRAGLQAGELPVPVPALGVGQVLQRPGDAATVSTVSQGDVPVTMTDVVPAFPGDNGSLPLVVVAADSFFSALGSGDPRVRPGQDTGRFDTTTEFVPSLWASTNLAALQAVTDARELERHTSTTYARAEQQPDIVAARSSTGYQVALGWCVTGLAVLGLAMFADRAATRARAADLMLARMGMGRAGTRRARAAELAAYALAALLLAGTGVVLIVPFGARLLDPGGGIAPAFVLRLAPTDVAVAALAVALGWLLSLVVTKSRVRASAGEVLRDAD